MPSNSTICPRNGPKRRQKAPKSAQCAPAPRNQERAVSWATWLKPEFRGHQVHPQPPTFYGFEASDSPNKTRRPPYQWSLGAAGGPASPRTVGANGGSTRVPGAKKIIFSKVVPRPLGMLKQVFLGRFEPVVARFGPWKIPKCLENGPFWDQKWFQNGSKTRFSESDPGPFGMLKQVFLARFEPVLTEFSPLHHMYAPLCALCTYLKAVWWSHLELGEGCRLEDIYIYIYISSNLHPSPNSRWLHHTALRYVRRAQSGAYMWWKGLNSVKTGKKHLFEHPKWSGITFGKTRF